MENWDDLRYLLAVYKSGTMSAAARELGTNVATVSRRMERLGQELGANPFVKTPAGWQPSPAVQGLLEAAAAFEGQMRRELNASPGLAENRPRLRLALPPLIAAGVLFPRLDAAGSPIDRVDIEFVHRIFQTGLGGNDVVIQAGRPDAGRLAIRCAGALDFGIYGWVGAGPTARWIGVTEAHDPFPPTEVARKLFGAPAAMRMENFEQVFQAMQVLRLPGPLPAMLAARQPGLHRLDNDRPPFRVEFWVMYHLSRRGDPAVQAVCDWVVQSFEALEQGAGLPPADV